MLKEISRFQDSTVFEGMTSIRAIIKGIDSGINTRRISKILFDKERLKNIAKDLGYLRAVAGKYGFDIVESSAADIENLAVGQSHGGLIAIADERVLPYLSDETDIPENGFFCLIQGIEDPYNFGYSIRSLFACGCDGIILGERNWMSAAGVVSRSSAGASEMMNIYRGADDLSTVDLFIKRGYTVVCADKRTDNVLGKCTLKRPILLLVGGEKRGLSKAMLEKADILVKIDYKREFSASLSAASATTMFAYEIMRQDSN